MAMTPEDLASHKARLAIIGLDYTEPFGPTDMSDPAVQKRMQEVAEAARRMPSIFNAQNDFDLGNQVRMLTRRDSAHEIVVCAARDRIFTLSLQLAILTEGLQQIVANVGSSSKPEEDDYDDTESAHNNGYLMSAWLSADIATQVLKKAGITPAVDIDATGERPGGPSSPDYLAKFPEEARPYADRAYQDGYEDGAQSRLDDSLAHVPRDPNAAMKVAALEAAEQINPGRSNDHIKSVALDALTIYRAMVAAGEVSK